ncbi:MAG: ACP S-malonyltransferase [Phycisphaerae bacterium]
MNKTAIIFPGQGSQVLGMGLDFYNSSPRAKVVFDAADEVLGYAISTLCFEGPETQLQRTDLQQPAIFVTSVAIWEALLEKGVPDDLLGCAAGLSLGEYTALHLAGAMGFEDALRLVAQRGRLMQDAAEASQGGMVTLLGADPQKVQALCQRAADGDVLAPANYNCPGQIVISGAAAACERAVGLASDFGAKAIPLKVAGAFHSAFMAPAAEQLGAALAKTPLTRPRVPVVSNVSADYHGEAESIRHSLQAQVTDPVLWAKSVERMIADGYDTFIEVGPGRVLTGLMRKIDRKVRAKNVSRLEDLDTVLGQTV